MIGAIGLLSEVEIVVEDIHSRFRPRLVIPILLYRLAYAMSLQYY